MLLFIKRNEKIRRLSDNMGIERSWSKHLQKSLLRPWEWRNGRLMQCWKKTIIIIPSFTTIYTYSLTLNINTPAIPEDPEDPSQLYPVVVFFHGGGSDSIWGSAFTALRMLEHKVVLVTLNYR
jgi:hypothetical protein